MSCECTCVGVCKRVRDCRSTLISRLSCERGVVKTIKLCTVYGEGGATSSRRVYLFGYENVHTEDV